jgi:hypothetical protein
MVTHQTLTGESTNPKPSPQCKKAGAGAVMQDQLICTKPKPQAPKQSKHKLP